MTTCASSFLFSTNNLLIKVFKAASLIEMLCALISTNKSRTSFDVSHNSLIPQPQCVAFALPFAINVFNKCTLASFPF